MRRTTPLKTTIINTRPTRADMQMSAEVCRGMRWTSSPAECRRIRLDIVLEQLGGLSCPDMT